MDNFLPNSRQRLADLKAGASTQCVLAFFGDSWINGDYWTRQFAETMQTSYGFAGLGWVGFQWFGTTSGAWVDGGVQPSGGGAGCARTDLSAKPVFSGTWTSDNGAGALASPSIGDASTSEAGAYVRFPFPAGHTSADLHYAGDGSGVVECSWDGGSTWGTAINLVTVGPAKVALPNVPAGAASLRIRRVSGNCRLTGVNMISSASGVVVHKLGASGSNSTQWASVNLATWAAQVNSLGVHLVGGLLGTNDQSVALATGTFAANEDAIMAALLAENALIDRLLIGPAENTRANAVAMAAYNAAARSKAVAGRYGYLDLAALFGSVPADYAFGTALGLLNASNLHPAPATGGALIANAMRRMIAPVH